MRGGAEVVAGRGGLVLKPLAFRDPPLLWRADREAALAYNRRDVEIEIEIARMCGCI